METIVLSSKGQLVIPKAVRESARLVPGDVLAVRYIDGEIRLRPIPSATALNDVAGCLAKPGRKRVSDAATKAAIKARLKARNATV
mgnify:CR=1 FL=1